MQTALQVMLSKPICSPRSTTGILNSWKEISVYIGRGVRTVQRYEAQLGFPVHRAAGKNRTAVMAFADEIDSWLRTTPKKVFIPANQVETNVEQATVALEEAYAAYQLCLHRYIEVKKTAAPKAKAFRAPG